MAPKKEADRSAKGSERKKDRNPGTGLPDSRQASWKDPQFRFRFCKVEGDGAKARMLERVYDGLDGGVRDNVWAACENLWQHYSPGKRMFECGPSWSLEYDVRTDSPGFFTGLTGWLPFLDPFLRAAYRKTLLTICRRQRSDGMFPIYPKHGQYKTEASVAVSWGLTKYRLDDYVDGHLVAIINGCEDVLFTRDVAFGRKRLPKLRRAMTYATDRKLKNGLMEVGYGGAFIELWFAFEGFPSTTQIFYIRALRLMAEVERLLGHPEEAERWLSFAPPIEKGLKRLTTRAGFFINAIDLKGKRHGDGRDYFETIPNVVAAPLGVIGEAQAKKIVAKIKTVPQLDEHCPIAVNFPGRTESFLPRVEARGVGAHWNGGAWMGFGGFEVWTHLIARDFAKAERLIHQMIDIRSKSGLQDFVAGFGAHQGGNVFRRKPCDHPIIFQQGAFGNTLRGLLGVQPRHDGLVLQPRIFPAVKKLEFTKPIYYGDREIYITIKNGKRISKVTVDGNTVKTHDGDTVFLTDEVLAARTCRVDIRY